MTLAEYQVESQRTNANLGSLMLNNIHMVLGMSSEIIEYNEAVSKSDIINIVEELTDIMWYLSNYCTQNGFDLNQLLNEEHTYDRNQFSYIFIVVNGISELSNIHKRELAYGKSINLDDVKTQCINTLHSLLNLYNLQKVDYEKCLQNNIDKLRKRFPNKFNNYDALNRNLNSERKELEK